MNLKVSFCKKGTIECLMGCFEEKLKTVKKIQGLATRLCGFDNDHAFPKRTPMYVLGTSVVRVFANWQQHPVSMSHKDRSIIHSKPLENISFT